MLDVVDQLDLEPFLRAYRADGHGHPAYDPKTLLGVLLYAYAIGIRAYLTAEPTGAAYSGRAHSYAGCGSTSTAAARTVGVRRPSALNPYSPRGNSAGG